MAKKLRNSSTGQIWLKKLFAQIMEILDNFQFYFDLFPVSYYSESTGVKSKHWNDFNKHCFEMFSRTQTVSIVKKPLRNS